MARIRTKPNNDQCKIWKKPTQKKKKSNDNFLKIQNKTPFLKMANEKKTIKNTAPINLLFLFIQFVEEKVGGEPLQLASTKCITFLYFFLLMWVFGSTSRTSTNPTSPEVNDHVSLQWSSY
jgi:hypothetical protein